MTEQEKPTLLLIDGHSLAFRAFYALSPDSFRTPDGQHTNAVHGFISMLLNILQGEKPSHLAVAFDLSRESFRTKLYPAYKGTRGETPPEFIGQTELLQEALANVIGQAKGRNITVATQGLDAELPVVYGSRHWLSIAVAEYLEQSIRSARPGGLIELSVQAVGTRVIVRARNQGLFVSNHERRSAFVPFGVGDSARTTDERTSIGLALSERIVAQHGGTVRIEDEFDAVDFVLEIPAGAPASQDAQLSVEQAQRYARDMAQLMARSMSKRVAPSGADRSES